MSKSVRLPRVLVGVLALVAPVVVLALVAPVVALGAVGAWRKVLTWGWRGEIPSGWKLVQKPKQDPKNPSVGQWTFQSDDEDYRLHVAVVADAEHRRSEKRVAERQL